MKTLIAIFFITGLTVSSWQFKSDASSSSIKVLGTSNVHDWESAVTEFTAQGTVADNVINGLKVSVPVKALSSGKSIMDEKSFEALKGSQYPTITFAADQLKISGTKITGSGKLTMAGVTKAITIEAESKSAVAAGVTVKGQVAVDMTQFGIEPPTAMFGSLKTSEKVTIEFQIILNK